MPQATCLSIDLSRQPSGLTLSARIAEGIAQEIRRGRFPPGSRLPSSRQLAEQLGVNRNTVLASLDDLLAQGYVRSEPRRGLFVSELLSQQPPKRRTKVAHPPSPRLTGIPLSSVPFTSPSFEPSADDLPLLGGMPDLRLTPRTELARAYRAALRDAPETLDYQSEHGQPRFLSAFGQFLAERRGVVTTEGELMTTRGSQQALYLAARAICSPQDVIAVEAFGYPPAWSSFRLAGAHLEPVRVDRGGIVLDDLRRLTERCRVRAVYVTPHHQYPTTVTMSGPRRTALLRLAREKKFYIIEDDYDHEFHFEGRPVLPLASFDLSAYVIHIGTFSKIFAPGLRLGYVAAEPRVIEAMGRLRRVLDRQGDHVTELALAYLIEDGIFAAHLRKVHRIYEARREVLHTELDKRLSGKLSFRRPSGGLAVWAKVHPLSGRRPRPELAALWAETAKKNKVIVQPARSLCFDGRHRSHLRLGYPRLDEHSLRKAVGLLARCYPG